MKYQLVLTEEQVEKNCGHIAQLESTNSYLQRVLQSDASLESEVRDLFYFEEVGSRWRKVVPFCSGLRPNHDARASELTDILNRMDLLSVNEIIRRDRVDELYFTGVLDLELGSNKIGTPEDLFNREVRVLGGYFPTSLGVFIATGAFYNCTSENVGETLMILFGASIFAVGGTSILSSTTTPQDYSIALKKAQRADAFMKGNYVISKASE